MPSAESNRRGIGRGLIQLYATEGGDSMITSGLITTTSTVHSKNIGFKPKMLYLSYELADNTEVTYVVCQEGITLFKDYDVSDYDNRTRTVLQQRVYIENNSVDSIIELTENGFTSYLGSGAGFYIAIG